MYREFLIFVLYHIQKFLISLCIHNNKKVSQKWLSIILLFEWWWSWSSLENNIYCYKIIFNFFLLTFLMIMIYAMEYLISFFLSKIFYCYYYYIVLNNDIFFILNILHSFTIVSYCIVFCFNEIFVIIRIYWNWFEQFFFPTDLLMTKYTKDYHNIRFEYWNVFFYFLLIFSICIYSIMNLLLLLLLFGFHVLLWLILNWICYH